MKEGPNLALLGSLIGDAARANMVVALLRIPALTAGELAVEAGVSAATASSHLRKLEEAGLLSVRQSGRHRYFELADDTVAHHIEQLMGLAQHLGHARSRPGPNEPALRRARICYDHLAGEIAVTLMGRLRANGAIAPGGEGITLTRHGRAMFDALGADVSVRRRGRPLCRECLDWSERRPHLAGAAGAALLGRMVELGWMHRVADTRAITVTRRGEQHLTELFVSA